MVPTVPRPILVPSAEPLPTPERLAKRAARARPTADQLAVLEALQAPPVGPYDLADRQGRRLIPAHHSMRSGSTIDALRARGAIELVALPCLCQRAPKLCECPRLAYRLASAPPRSNLIDAAHRFRRAG